MECQEHHKPTLLVMLTVTLAADSPSGTSGCGVIRGPGVCGAASRMAGAARPGCPRPARLVFARRGGAAHATRRQIASRGRCGFPIRRKEGGARPAGRRYVNPQESDNRSKRALAWGGSPDRPDRPCRLPRPALATASAALAARRPCGFLFA